jgi:drug/metabolite transporter (DMT)-like permease
MQNDGMDVFKKSIRGDAMLFASVFFWAANFTVVKWGMEEHPEARFTFLALRFLVASACFLPFVLPRIRREARLIKPAFSQGSMVGVVLVFAYALQVSALAQSSAGRVAFITSMNLALVPIFALLLGRERMSALTGIGCGLSMGGIVVLSYDGSQASWGDILAALCAVGFAIDVLLVDRFSKVVDPLFLTFGIVVTVGVLSAFLAVTLEHSVLVPALSQRFLAGGLFAGVFATAIAFHLQTLGQRHTTPIQAAIIFSAEPVIALAIAYFGSQEAMTLHAFLGCCAIVAGVALSEISRTYKSKATVPASPRDL